MYLRTCVAISPDQRVLAVLLRLLDHSAMVVSHSHYKGDYAEQEHKGTDGRRSRQVNLKRLVLKALDDAKIAKTGGSCKQAAA